MLLGNVVDVLLADDHGLFRDSMAVWLEQLAGTIKIDFAANFNAVHENLSLNSYDLLLLDLGMEGMEGAISIRKFVTLAPKLPVLVVSADETPETVMSCIEAGAIGYITKSASGENILQAINQVLKGEKYIPANLVVSNAHKLSDKQRQILKCIIDGDSNKIIAEKLHLSEGTVKQYVSKLLMDLDVDNRGQAANKARKMLGIN